MFIERLKTKFTNNTPIFLEEILEIFSDFSRAQVFRYIKEAKNNKQLIQYDKGVYFIPKETVLGYSTISADNVAYKKYIKKENDIYGIYNGLKLLNSFSITTQIPSTIEIITNKESSKRREIKINNRCFILRKPYCQITKENVFAYTVLQLFNELNKEDNINEIVKQKLLQYIKDNDVTKKDIYNLSTYFPSIVSKNLIRSGLLNEITQ